MLPVALIAAAATATVAAERSELVELDEIRVHGAELLDQQDVVELTGLEPGTSTLRVRLSEVARRVESNPAVDTATVRRVDPVTVQVQVREHVPAMAVKAVESRWYAVDRRGVVLAEASDEDRDGVPVLRLSTETLPVGAAVAATSRAAEYLAALADYELDGDVDEFWLDDGEMYAQVRSGAQVRFGGADHTQQKARALDALLRATDGEEVARIDLTAPTRPAVRFRDDVEAP